MPEAHLSDERLSALLDDVEAPDAHVDDCGSCRARLEQLRDAAGLVATPVPALSASAIDELVTRAISAGTVTPLAEARARRTRRTPSAALLGAVAAVLVVVLAVPLLLRSSGSQNDRGLAASRPTADEETGADSGSGESAATGRATAEADDAAAITSGGAVIAAPATTNFGSIATDEELVRVLIASMSTAGTTDGSEGAPASTTPEIPAACEGQARTVGGGRLGGMVHAAALTWRGTDAEVLVFALTEPVDGLTRQAYVMARPGCRVLAEPRF